MFAIYSSALQLCYIRCTDEKNIFSTLKRYAGRNFEGRTLRFFAF